MLAIYTRLSKEDSKSTSIENQIQEGKMFAQSKNFLNYEIYNEGEGISGGATIKDRPKLDALIQDINSGLVNTVWFRNQNRLERDTQTYIIFMKYAESNNVDVYFDNKRFDFENATDNMLGIFISGLNQYTRKLQSQQTKRVLKNKAKEGKVWSVVAYGYKSDNGYLAVDKEESIIIKEIFKMSLSGIGTDSIADILSDRGVLSRKGLRFRGRTIHFIIKNTIYKGKRLYSGEFYNCPLIIEPNQWQKVNDNLENNRNNSGKKVEHKYLLKGLLKCGKCGRNYYGHSRINGKDNTYICSSRRHKDMICNNKGIFIPFIEGLVWRQMFNDKLFLKAYLDFISNNNNSEEVKEIECYIKDINNKISKNEKSINTLLDKLLEGGFGADVEGKFKLRMNSISKETDTLKVQQKNYLEDLEQYKNYKNSSISDELDKDLSDASFNIKQQLIKQFIDEIVITFDEEGTSGNYYIEIKPKVKGMKSIIYLAPFSKKYAIEINDFIIEDISLTDVSSIKPKFFLPRDMQEGHISINFNSFNYYLSSIKKAP
jgi:DNA invertase Pin-like site-specific DNA recombinase